MITSIFNIVKFRLVRNFAYSQFSRPAGPHFPASQGRINRPVLERDRAESGSTLLIRSDCHFRRLRLLNQYSKSCSQSAPDPIKLAVALLLVTQLVSPLIW